MQVTSDTLYTDFAKYEPYLTDEGRERILEAAKRQFGEYTEMNIEQFSDMVNLTELEEKYNTVFGVYWLNGFKDFIEGFSKTVSNFTLQPTPMEVSASSVCYDTTMLESMLVFSQQYFGLKSFAEAAKTTLGDYLIARKADYNSKAFERRFNEIQMQKMKSKQ